MVVMIVEQRVALSLRAGGSVPDHGGEVEQRVAPATEALELRHAEPALRRLLGSDDTTARLLMLLLLLPGPGEVPAQTRPRRRAPARPAPSPSRLSQRPAPPPSPERST